MKSKDLQDLEGKNGVDWDWANAKRVLKVSSFEFYILLNLFSSSEKDKYCYVYSLLPICKRCWLHTVAWQAFGDFGCRVNICLALFVRLPQCHIRELYFCFEHCTVRWKRVSVGLLGFSIFFLSPPPPFFSVTSSVYQVSIPSRCPSPAKKDRIKNHLLMDVAPLCYKWMGLGMDGFGSQGVGWGVEHSANDLTN